MPFTKLDSGIVDSSLWAAPDHIVRVWITILAKKDHDGMVRIAPSALQRVSNIYDDSDGIKFREAINVLESPDPESRTMEFDGRRIEKVEGGWVVLNHEKYRLHDNIIREQNRERVRKFREKQRLMCKKTNNSNAPVTLCNVTGALPSVSVSVSESVSLEEEHEKEISEFETFRLIYPGQKRSKETEFNEFKLKYQEYRKILPVLVESVKRQIEDRRKLSSNKKFVPSWKSLQNYIAGKGWEEELLPILPKKDPPKPYVPYTRTKEEMEVFLKELQNEEAAS